jgi:hypothetical protein
MEGGLILFGVDDDGIVQGLTPSNVAHGLRVDLPTAPAGQAGEEFLINVARNNCEPSLLVEIDEADTEWEMNPSLHSGLP